MKIIYAPDPGKTNPTCRGVLSGVALAKTEASGEAGSNPISNYVSSFWHHLALGGEAGLPVGHLRLKSGLAVVKTREISRPAGNFEKIEKFL